MNFLSRDEQLAASVVAGLSAPQESKRERDSPDDAAGGAKKPRAAEEEESVVAAPPPPVEEQVVVVPAAANDNEPQPQPQQQELQPYPFYYYVDHSQKPDPDSLTPLTPPGRVPSFVAKMHAILSRADLQEIVAWQPHGRSWKVLKPREFEVRVVPVYFEHAKFSSFIRQANGWGFRRITTGHDRNSYYHPLFLRGLPHLCKEMKRPGVAKKLPADPDHEPDLYRISELFPLPLKAADEESILLPCTLQGGPKARMPIYSGSLSSTLLRAAAPTEPAAAAAAKPQALSQQQWTPRDQEVFSSFGQSLFDGAAFATGGSDNQNDDREPAPLPVVPAPAQAAAPASSSSSVQLPANSVAAGPQQVSTLAAANNLAFQPTTSMLTSSSASVQMQNTLQQAQFAAGFAAAAAMFQSFSQQAAAQLSAQQQQQPPAAQLKED